MESDFCELCKTGNPVQIQGAIQSGSSLSERNEHDRTPLMCAAGNNGCGEVISLLLNSGAAVNETSSSGKTALLLAAGYNTNPEVLLILLKAGADAKAKDGTGKTVLDYADENMGLKGTQAYEILKRAQG